MDLDRLDETDVSRQSMHSFESGTNRSQINDVKASNYRGEIRSSCHDNLAVESTLRSIRHRSCI